MTKTVRETRSKTKEFNDKKIKNQIIKKESTKLKKERKQHVCDVCQKVFLGLNDLRKHLRIHNDERPYACPHCDKKFRQGGCLKNHVASQHGSDVQFICNYCNKGFPIKERLRLHLRIHTGEKPYSCLMCPKKFARGGQVCFFKIILKDFFLIFFFVFS